MAPVIKNPSFAPQLLAYLSQNIADQPTRRVPALREYLTGKKGWTQKTSTAVDECITNDSVSSLALRRLIINAMRHYCTDLQSLYAPVILTWGLNQSWASTINTGAVLHHWAVEHSKNPKNTTSACHHATTFLTQLVAIQQDVPSIWRQQVFADVVEAMLVFSNAWKSASLPPTIAGSFLLNLGHAVQVCPTAQRGQESLLSLCTRYTRMAIEGTNVQTQMSVSTALVDSKLPEKYKLAIHEGLRTTLWSMARNTFRPLLPADEIQRFSMLPFDEPTVALANMETWAKAEYIENNNNIVRQYCPHMYPILALATTQDDWCQRACIQAQVDRFNSLETQALELPEGVIC